MQVQKKLTMETKQKIKSWVIFFVIVFMVYGALYAVFNFVPFFKNKEKFIIVSQSMEPLIEVGDLVVVNKTFTESDLLENVIIAFYEDLNDDGKEEIIVHYIAKVNDDGLGNLTYKTRRYNVQSYVDWDEWELTKDDIIGVYYTNLKKIGSILLFVESTFGKIVILVDILVIYWVIKVFTEEDKNKKIN